MKSNQNQFILSIIQSIQIEVDDFTQRVANKECYELMIYRWSMRLFLKGLSSKQAIKIIHRARNFILLHRVKNSSIYKANF